MRRFTFTLLLAAKLLELLDLFRYSIDYIVRGPGVIAVTGRHQPPTIDYGLYGVFSFLTRRRALPQQQQQLIENPAVGLRHLAASAQNSQ